ncbi:DMT family transporter [Arthrobacter sp. UYEF36]|uniref:DMT family transporter n=1 Tax=Arthrobacter sp. UYEF36 TaxID=1756366 RepID=UPI00339AD88E
MGLVLLSALAFGSTPAFVRLAYSAQINGVSLVAFRCLIAAAVLWILSRTLGEGTVRRRSALRLVAIGAVLFGPQMWSYFAALHLLDTSVTVAVVYVYPAIVAVLVAFRLRKLPRRAELILLLLALGGIAMIALFNGAALDSTTGMLLAGLTAVGYAIYVVVADTAVRDVPPNTAASLVLVGAGASSVLAALVTQQLELPTSPAGWSYIALHGLIIVPIGLASYYAGLKRLGAARTSVVDTSQPAIAAGIGVAALGEQLAFFQIVGIVAVMVAVLGLPIMAAAQAAPRGWPASPRVADPSGMSPK